MIKLIKYSSEEWEVFAEDAHKIAFKYSRPKEMNRIDFALLAVNEKDDPIGFTTCREINKDTIYWQFGGGTPVSFGKPVMFKAYKELVKWNKKRYKRVNTLIRNDNIVMLKMAFKVGFRIIGIKFLANNIFLELTLNLEV